MALNTLLDAIRREASEKVQRIDRETAEKVDVIHQSAHARAEAEIERFVAEAKGEAEREMQREVNAANLRSTRAQTDVRRKVYDSMFDEVQQRLSQVRSSTEYPNVFLTLVCDAIHELGSGVTVHIDPRDQSLMDALLTSHASTVTSVVADLSTMGGVIAVAATGRITRDNTLEARLERVRNERSRDIWDVLEP